MQWDVATFFILLRFIVYILETYGIIYVFLHVNNWCLPMSVIFFLIKDSLKIIFLSVHFYSLPAWNGKYCDCDKRNTVHLWLEDGCGRILSVQDGNRLIPASTALTWARHMPCFTASPRALCSAHSWSKLNHYYFSDLIDEFCHSISFIFLSSLMNFLFISSQLYEQWTPLITINRGFLKHII